MREIPTGFHPEAADEAQAAVDWYAKRSIRAAQRFLEELEIAIAGSNKLRIAGRDSMEKPGAFFFDGSLTL